MCLGVCEFMAFTHPQVIPQSATPQGTIPTLMPREFFDYAVDYSPLLVALFGLAMGKKKWDRRGSRAKGIRTTSPSISPSPSSGTSFAAATSTRTTRSCAGGSTGDAALYHPLQGLGCRRCAFATVGALSGRGGGALGRREGTG